MVLVAALSAAGQPSFRVSLRPEAAEAPQSGRLVVYLIKDGARVRRGAEPADGPFFSDPQPMVGLWLENFAPGDDVLVDDKSIDAAFPAALAELAPGRYTAQAVLDTQRSNSSWRREPGNIASEPSSFVITQRQPSPVVDLRLTEVVARPLIRPAPGLEFFSAQSIRLTDFRGVPTNMNAAVIFPKDYDPDRAYPAVYQIPGFGGDHFRAFGIADRRQSGTPEEQELLSNAFWIVLDPEGPNGHHLFVNSANNGPVADALIQEFIPALEQRFNLIAEPTARMLRGHSSGGWSTLWLATHYPQTFGATWSTAPDPVDFSRFQSVDIYNDANMFIADGEARPSYTAAGQVQMTIAEENAMEQVLGPRNTAAQQWDSWLAVFGPRGDDANPAALYDPVTGVIDQGVAEAYRKFDIHEQLRRNRATQGKVFLSRVRLVVGDRDNFDLHRAVHELRKTVATLDFYTLPDGRHGYIEIVPGADHSDVVRSEVVRGFPREMLEHIERFGHR